MRKYQFVKCITCGEETTIVNGEPKVCESCARIDGVKRSHIVKTEHYADENTLHE